MTVTSFTREGVGKEELGTDRVCRVGPKHWYQSSLIQSRAGLSAPPQNSQTSV